MSTRYIVLGAGSVGAVIGARFFEQGIDVVLIARGDHLRAIQRSGLTLETPVGTTTLRVPAVAHPSEIVFRPEEDVVLVATKTQDAGQALDDLRHVAGMNIPVVCLQNGVEAARIAARRFELVIGAMTMLPSVHLHAGSVQAFASPVTGIIDVGCYPGGELAVAAAVAIDLRRAGFQSEVRTDILRWQYGKLLDNLKNVLQALCGPTVDYGDVVKQLRSEAEACYQAAGIAYAAEPELRRRARGLLSLGTVAGRTRPGDSSWQSLARGTGSIETDYLNGEIALLARMHGVAATTNARLQELANHYARERRAPGGLAIEELRQLLREGT